MSQYLSKEEIKRWRSSLEKITLEEYAKRLGKVLEEDKKTSDIIDLVIQNEKRLYTTKETNNNSILKISKKSVDMQRNAEITPSEYSVDTIKSKLNFHKKLTQREDMVLDHFIKNHGQVVYARDLAAILNLPCDYVYKYIKNLRAKICKDFFQNAVKGGYIFKIDN